ncbi:MAG: DUF2723 domain-containing protein [Candidatus Sumerlaeaceae bacterium]|nr:DUF2723 domain-containing protein [Candidatus Sumerlaeaceae bacterium]
MPADPVPLPVLPAMPAVIVGILAFFVYLRTMAPSMHFGDGLEFASAAKVLGIPHPTGYPLYMILLKLFTFIPIGEVITRTTLFSVVCSAVSAGLSTLILRDVLQRVFRDFLEKAVLVASAAFGLGGALLELHWQNATLTELNALHFLLVLCFLRAAQRFVETGERRFLILVSLVLGLGIAHHRMSVFLGLPFLLLWVKAAQRMGMRDLRGAMWRSALCLLAGLSLYLYLPLRAMQRPAVNWGDASSFGRFYRHVRAEEYLKFRFLMALPDRPFNAGTYPIFAEKSAAMLLTDFVGQVYPVQTFPELREDFGRNFNLARIFAPDHALKRPNPSPPWALDKAYPIVAVLLLGLTIFGGRVWVKGDRFCFWLGALVSGQHILFVFLYNILDISDYFLVPFWFGWICGSVGILAMARWVSVRISAGGLARRPEWAYALIALPIIMGTSKWRQCDRSRDNEAERLTYHILPEDKKVMPEGSILLTGGDPDVYTSWYRQIARGERTDVLVFGSNFVATPWYSTIFTPEQVAKYDLKFAPTTAYDHRQFVRQVLDGVVDRNIGRYPIFTTITDAYVLQEINKYYGLGVVSAINVKGMIPTVDESTVTLLRILPRTPKEAAK